MDIKHFLLIYTQNIQFTRIPEKLFVDFFKYSLKLCPENLLTHSVRCSHLIPSENTRFSGVSREFKMETLTRLTVFFVRDHPFSTYPVVTSEHFCSGT